jgi:hypothetical protein
MQIQVFHNVDHDSFFGYQPHHPLVRVFRGEHQTGETDPAAVAEELFEAFNIGGRFPQLAEAYRARQLRSLSVGDVVAVGEVPLAVASAGFKPVEGFPDVVTDWPETSVTVIWRD